MRLLLILSILLSITLAAQAQTPDTPANRQAAAERYVKESGLQQVVLESASMVAGGFTPQERIGVLRNYMQYLDQEKIRTVMVTAMAQRFTLEEIEAIRHFATSPAGKSVMSKLGAYASDISPTVQSVSADALGKVLLEMRRKSRESGPEKK